MGALVNSEDPDTIQKYLYTDFCWGKQVYYIVGNKNSILFVKDICGYFQCAPFPRLQTRKVVWVLSFDP